MLRYAMLSYIILQEAVNRASISKILIRFITRYNMKQLDITQICYFMLHYVKLSNVILQEAANRASISEVLNSEVLSKISK